MNDKALAHAHAQGPSSEPSAKGEPSPLTDARCAAPSRYFPADLVVSRTVSGDVASRFADDSWNMSHMSTDGTSTQTLVFYKCGEPEVSELALLIRQQQKALMWLHMDTGKVRAWVTLQYTNFALTQWCARAENQGTDLFTLLSDPQAVSEHLQELNKTYLTLTSPAIQTLWRHRAQLGARMDMQVRELRQAVVRESSSREESRQTPLIPSRVYLAVLVALDRDMDRIEAELDKVLAGYATERTVSRETPAGLTPTQRIAHRAKHLKGVKGVAQAMVAQGYDPKAVRSLEWFILDRINQYQMTLMLTVVAYTGMRRSEVLILTLEDCLGEFEFLGSTHYEVQGATHKLNQGVKREAGWVTSHQGVRAIRLAQRIGRVIALHHETAARKGQQALLFASTDNPYRKKSSRSFDHHITAARARLCPEIDAQDMAELDRLELGRGWAKDGIEVGQRWPLAMHQLRRSLAVYGHRSGMVSLPALKAQLQHITQEMGAYYARNFSAAINLVFDQKHIAHEWEAAKAESSYFAYALGLLLADDELLGQGVTRMGEVVERRTRQETLNLFTQGKVAYRETVLGGCISTEACKTDPLEPIPYDCLESNCVNMVVLGKRLDTVIKSQKGAVAMLEKTEPGSVEHRLELRSLEVLLKAKSRLQRDKPKESV
jgi:integrase